MWPLKILQNFGIFQISDKTALKKKKKVRKYLLFLFINWDYKGKTQTCLLASLAAVQVLVNEGKWTWNKFMTLFIYEGKIPLGIAFF